MRFIALFAFVFFTLISYSQNTGIINGAVVNTLDGQIGGVKVKLLELDTTVVTSSDGDFKFTNLPKEEYTLYAIYEGLSYALVKVDLREKERENVQVPVGFTNVNLDEVHLKTRSKMERLKNNAIKADIVSMKKYSRRATSVEDLVNRAPGVKIRNVGGLGSSSNIVVGGFTGNAVKFLYDNIPIDYLGSNYGLTKAPINTIGRVEIYKGVLPTKIGVDALGSAINIVPKKRNKTSGSISYETGSYNTHIATINANIKATDHLFVGTNSFFNYSENNYEVDNLPYLNAETGQTKYIKAPLFHNDFKQRSLEFFIQGRNLPWADLIEFKVNSYDLNKDIQNDPYSRARPFGEVYRSESGDFIPSLKYKNHFFDDRLSVNQFLVFSKIDYELFDRAKNVYYDWKGEAHTTTSSSEMGNLLLDDGYLQNEFQQITSRTNLNYLISDQFQLESNTVFSNYNRKSSADDLNPGGTTYNKLITNFAFNAQLFDDKLESNTQIKYLFGHLSGRYEKSDNPLESVAQQTSIENTGISFSEALKYNIDQQQYVRLSYENTYRLPEQRELFGDNNFIVANYNLVPEKSNNINLGYTYLGQDFGFEVNSYYRDSEDLIRLKDLNQYQASYLNLDHVRGFGVELEVNYEPVKNLHLSGNLTWNDFRLESSKDKSIDNQHYKNARIANMPFYYGNLSASYNLKDLLNLTTDFSFFWNYSYVHQYYLDFIEKKFEPDGFLGLWGESKINTSRIIPEQNVHSFGVVYTRDLGGQSVSLSAELKNAFDEAIYNEFKMQSPGRHFRVKLTYSF